MRSHLSVVALAILTFPISACPRTPATRPPSSIRHELRAELLGCYALYTPAGKLLDSSFYNASPLVRLDSVSTGKGPMGFRSLVRLDSAGTPIDPDPRSPFGRDWWADSLSDSVRLSFSDGFSGAVVILAAPPGQRDTLWGRIEEHWDMGPTVNQRGRVQALRLACRGAA